jgi:ABC-type nitrate/sulfonate/bicarbonate transport system substrate-binding protein
MIPIFVSRQRDRLSHSMVLAGSLVILIAIFAAACSSDSGDAQSPEPVKISFMAGFRAQANLPFVAAYVGKEKGFFTQEGLDVTIRHSSGQNEHLKLLLEDAVQFTTATSAQMLRRRAEEIPVVAVALFGQRGDQGFVTRADSGIETPADFSGRSVGFKAGVIPAELHALLKTAGLTVGDVDLQGVGFDPRLFIEGSVDVYPVFLDNEPDTIRRAGLEINVIDPHEFGVPTLGLTYLVTEKMLEERRDVTERYLRATLRAVDWIKTHVDEAVEITLIYAEGADPEHQKFLLTTDLTNAARADGIGRSTPDQWAALRDVLIEFHVLEDEVDVESAFDGSMVDAFYEGGGID